MGQEEEGSGRVSRRSLLSTAVLVIVAAVAPGGAYAGRALADIADHGEHCHCCKTYGVLTRNRCVNGEWVSYWSYRCTVCAQECYTEIEHTGYPCDDEDGGRSR